MPVVAIHARELLGTAGMFLFLRGATDGVLLNAGGDALTESPASSGRFTCTVAETISVIHSVGVYDSATESALTILRQGWIEAGGTLVYDEYPLLDLRIPAALIGGRMDASLGAIGTDTVPASNLAKSASAIATCTAATGGTTTSIPTSACSPVGSAADQFKGRIVIFTRDTATVSLRGQATNITASTAAASPTFTVTALTTAPVSGDTFVVV